MTKAERYRHSRVRFLLDAMRQARPHRALTVGLGWVSNPPVSNQDLGQAICSLFPSETTHLAPPSPNGTLATWTIGAWVFQAAHNRVLVEARQQPSAHSLLAVETVLLHLDRERTTG